MKKFLYMGLIALAAIGATSCTDDNDFSFATDSDPERLLAPLFRFTVNTGYGSYDQTTNTMSDDPTSCCVIEDESGTMFGKPIYGNTLYFSWFGVEGAVAYQVQLGIADSWIGSERWDNPAYIVVDTIVEAPNVSLYIHDLDYEVNYRPAIRAIHPEGYNAATKTIDESCTKHSNWHNKIEQASVNKNVETLKTKVRYDVPDAITVKDYTFDQDQMLAGFTIVIDLSTATNGTGYTDHFDIDETGSYYLADHMTIAAGFNNPEAKVPSQYLESNGGYDITGIIDDEGKGEIVVWGLDPNCSYVVNVKDFNSGRPSVDAAYNTLAPRTDGIAGEPILIEWNPVNDSTALAGDYYPEELGCSLLDDVLIDFMGNSALAEGQIFELEGGKTYYIRSNVEMSKGMTLRTRPEDVKAGKRATVWLNGVKPSGTTYSTSNFIFGMAQSAGMSSSPITIKDLIFEDIDFDCPGATNTYVTGGNGSGNYFGNMYSTSLPVTFQSLQIINCSFQHCIRGFIRLQSSARKVFDKVLVENCVFYNNGLYTTSGQAYNWMHSDEGKNPKTNFFANAIWRGNTLIDSPLGTLMTDKDATVSWPSSTVWNMTVENNTFVNFNTMSTSTGNSLFRIKIVPNGSTFTAENNLFIQTKRDEDTERTLNLLLVYTQTIYGGNTININIRNNYGCTSDTDKQYDDGMVTSQAFSATKNAFGAYASMNNSNGGEAITYGAENLPIKVGENPLLPTELMKEPNARINHGELGGHDYSTEQVFSGMFYNKTDKVTSHEIYINGIGDTRWRDANDKTSFWMLKSRLMDE